MRKAYLETSAFNQIVAGIPANLLREILGRHGLKPTISTTVIYECARTFTRDPARGKELFQALVAFEDILSFVPRTSEMLTQEVVKLRTGAHPLPFMDTLNQMSTRLEIRRLAAGDSKEAEEFTRKRQGHYDEIQAIQDRHYLENIRAKRDTNPRLRTFDDVYFYFKPQLPTLIGRSLNRHCRVTKAEARELASRLDHFPMLRSVVRANCRIAFHHIVHDVPPGRDKWDDYSNIIDAAYCDVFVTADAQAVAAVRDINPNLVVITFDGLFAPQH
jgi:hypothetical protein